MLYVDVINKTSVFTREILVVNSAGKFFSRHVYLRFQQVTTPFTHSYTSQPLRDALKSSILPNMFGTNMKFSKNLA
jgi:phosphoribosylformylglycinamidine (FGAM) synthase-like amidotransferase family enzyme